MQYATTAAWKLWAADNTAYFTNAEDTSLDGVIADCLEAASRQIDNDCGRVFYRLEAEARDYRVDDDGYVRCTDLVEITTVEYDSDLDDTADTALAATDYLAGPLVDDHGRAPLRYQWLKRRHGSAYWPGPGTIVTITGDWGYVESDGAPPPDVVQACIIRAGRLFARREAKLGTVSVPQMGTVGVIRGQDQDYLDLIRPYVRTDTGVGYAVT